MNLDLDISRIYPDFCLQDQHLAVPEIPLEDQERLQLIPVQLSAQQGWRQLDEQSAWQQFSLQNLEQAQQLLQAGDSLGEDFDFWEGMGTTDLGKVWGFPILVLGVSSGSHNRCLPQFSSWAQLQ